MAMQIRRVVSGEVGGKAKVVSDGIVTAASLDGASELALIWSGDEAPRFPLSGEQPKTQVYFPTLGGYRFVIFTVPPAGEAAAVRDRLTPEAQARGLADLEAHIGTGLTDWMEPDHPGMHTTETVDFDVVVSGRWRRGSVESRRLRGAERNTPRLAEPVGAALCDRRHSRGSRAGQPRVCSTSAFRLRLYSFSNVTTAL